LNGTSARRKISTYTGQHDIGKRAHTSMPRAEYEISVQDV